MKRFLLIVGIALIAAAPLVAQTPWIHVEVDETGDDQSRVNVNLPLSVVRVAMQAAPERFIDDGRVHLNHFDQDLDVEDLRKLWTELRDSGNAEFVTVEEEDETVRIRRDGNYIRIDVEERSGNSPERVHVDIPVAVVDALFSGDGDSLNLEDALSELSSERGDVVRVDDGETKVRIWIDEKD